MTFRQNDDSMEWRFGKMMCPHKILIIIIIIIITNNKYYLRKTSRIE